jgi:heat shock protein HtpX
MACALVLLAMIYGALWYGVFALFTEFPAFWPYWIFVVIALISALAGHYHGADKALLASVGAELVERGAEPHLEASLERLAALAVVPAPRLALADTDAANAFAVGLSQHGAAVVVTRGLRERLDEKELEAVLAHEMAHIANRDAAVLTAVAAPRILGEVMVGGASSTIGLVWYLIWPLGIPIYLVGALLTLPVSRYREFAADHGSALLTGAPEQLMSALRKLATDAVEIPHEDLRAANCFCIVPTEATILELFSDHPPTEKRLAALAEIAREMGRPVPG